MLRPLVILLFASAACSTTYRFKGEDLDRVREGTAVANVQDAAGQDVDFTHYSFVYRTPDANAPLRIKGIESLNRSAEDGMLKTATRLDAVPGINDKAWQRSILGAGIGFVAGLGIGYAITNRVLVERSAREGDQCTTCTVGFLMLGTLVSAILGGGAGSILAYFGGSGVGQVRPAKVQFLGDEPASQAVSLPADVSH